MRLNRPVVEARGHASVAVGGDAAGPILVNSPVQIRVLNGPAPQPTSRPVLLPPDVPDFVGRASDIETIEDAARKGHASGAPTTVVVSGKPGVGKTSLAVHLAHRLEGRHPDGVLYADLRGVDDEPASPDEIALRLLHACDVPADEIPADPYARLDAYRQRVAQRALLIIFDNAADEKQVRPLLPSGVGSTAIVTSRSRMAGLESVRTLDLDTFPTHTSLAFLAKVTGDRFEDGDRTAALSVADHCGHLPLALRIAANRLQSTPRLTMAALACELGNEHDRLGALEVGDLAVRKAFNLSYRKLGKGCKNTFRKLSDVPATDFGTGICAALTGSGEKHAARALRKLAEANLVEPSTAPGRYRFHDLLKAFAREKAGKRTREEADTDRRRMILWLRDSALRAQSHITGTFRVEIPDDSGAPLSSLEAATLWVEQELSNAVAALPVSESLGSARDTATLALSLGVLCESVGRWSDWDTVCDAGLRAAVGADKVGLEAVFLTSKANLARYRRDFDEALSHATRVYEQARVSREPLHLAGAANLLGCLKMDIGRSEEGLPFLRESLEIYEEFGVRHEVAKVLYNLGTMHRASGDTDTAIEYFERDLAVCLDTGDEAGAAETLNTLALTYSELGRLGKAEELQLKALATFSKIGNPHKVSMIFNDLAITLRRQGRYEAALDLHTKDVELCRGEGNASGEALAHSNAAEVLHRLGRNREAAEKAALAQTRFAELGDEQRLAQSMISHISILFEDGKAEEATEQAARATEILTRFGQLKDVAATHQVLAREFGLREQWEKSLTHAEESLRVGDGIVTPYSRAVGCTLALLAGTRAGRGEEVAGHRDTLRAIFAEDPELRDLFPGAREL
ncbi:tetratricopeptide repeat protein [Streptomyces sp. NPDC051000]|uniref:ATP-binding protein n=1 Tax=Streptomyces sp. NPDC051000 TaxID=3155520 RepID=UPI0033DA08AC